MPVARGLDVRPQGHITDPTVRGQSWLPLQCWKNTADRESEGSRLFIGFLHSHLAKVLVTFMSPMSTSYWWSPIRWRLCKTAGGEKKVEKTPLILFFTRILEIRRGRQMYLGIAGHLCFRSRASACSAAATQFYSRVPAPKHSHRAVLGQKLISSPEKSMETELCGHTLLKFCSIRSLYTM